MNMQISGKSRFLILLVAIALSCIYFVPIWLIDLQAPQYRDGLQMLIWLNKISGGGEFDLRNINLLNHYVGMREIHASDFVEFTYMPYILGVLVLGAVVTFFYSKMFMVYLGLVSFIITALAGLYDLHRWEYNYGHNLDPNAALSIPGISFEPPVLGCKAMMNFYTCSWPHVGGWLLLLSGGAICFIIFYELRKRKVNLNKI